MKKVSVAIGEIQFRFGDKQAIGIASKIGADAVDFCLEDFGGAKGRFDYRNPSSVYALPRQELIRYFQDIKEYADSLGVEICQTHGRGKGFLGNAEEDDALVKNAELDCLVTSVLGAPVCVMHTATTSFHRTATPDEMCRLNDQMFIRILPYAKKYGVKVATETFGDIHGGEVCEYFGYLDNFIAAFDRICAQQDFKEWFTVCMDTGHTNKATKFEGNPSVPEAIRKLGSRITCLHINDNDTSGDQHLIPFCGDKGWQINGTIDWKQTLCALDEIGYDGAYNLELFLYRYGENMIVETAEFGLKVMKSMINS